MEIPIINPLAPKPSQLLRQALDLFGPNGENWIQKAEHKSYKPWWGFGLYTIDRYCAIGTIIAVNTANQQAATSYLVRAIPEPACDSIVGFNDKRGRTFPEIKAWFNSAIAAAEANGQ